MKSLGSAVSNLLARRGGVMPRVLIWIEATRLDNGAAETLGLWNGVGNRTFIINGQSRDYYGAGSLINLADIKQSKGIFIRKTSAKLAKASKEVVMLIRGYNPYFAPAEMHLINFDPLTGNQVGDPYRFMKGWVNFVNAKTPPKNGSSDVIVDFVGNSRLLTNVNPSRRSDESQRKRQSNDEFFKYVNPTGTIPVAWGEAMAGQASGSVIGTVNGVIGTIRGMQ